MSKRISNDTQKQYQAVHEQYYNSILLNVQLEQQAQIRNIDFFEDKHIVLTHSSDVQALRTKAGSLHAHTHTPQTPSDLH